MQLKVIKLGGPCLPNALANRTYSQREILGTCQVGNPLSYQYPSRSSLNFSEGTENIDTHTDVAIWPLRKQKRGANFPTFKKMQNKKLAQCFLGP